MEQVFEDFVTASFRRHQNRYRVVPQGPREFMATIDGSRAFAMRPDIALKDTDGVAFILDAKWKRIDAGTGDRKHGIGQSDLYQLYAYAARYGCKAVALVYPANPRFATALSYAFFDGTALLAIPFRVTDPERSVAEAIESLERSASRAIGRGRRRRTEAGRRPRALSSLKRRLSAPRSRDAEADWVRGGTTAGRSPLPQFLAPAVDDGERPPHRRLSHQWKTDGGLATASGAMDTPAGRAVGVARMGS